MAIFHSNGWKFFFDLPCVKRWEFWVMFLLLYCITYCSPPVLKSFRHFPHTTGDFETSSLPCLAWWNWFLSWWPAKSYPLSVICVRFQAPFCFSSFCNVSLVTNIFFHLFQLSKKYYCNLYWWVYYMPLLVFHKENLFELSQFIFPLYLSNSLLIILSLCSQLLQFAMLTLLHHKWGSLLSLRIHLTPALPQLGAFLFPSSLGFIRMSKVQCFSAEILIAFRKYAASFVQFLSP